MIPTNVSVPLAGEGALHFSFMRVCPYLKKPIFDTKKKKKNVVTVSTSIIGPTETSSFKVATPAILLPREQRAYESEPRNDTTSRRKRSSRRVLGAGPPRIALMLSITTKNSKILID